MQILITIFLELVAHIKTLKKEIEDMKKQNPFYQFDERLTNIEKLLIKFTQPTEKE